MDEEKAGVEDLLRRGEELMQQTPDESQREEFRVLLVRLQSQYSAHRVRCFKDSLFFRGSCLGILFLFIFFCFELKKGQPALCFCLLALGVEDAANQAT